MNTTSNAKPAPRRTKIQLATFVPPALHQAVAALAEKEDRSIAYVVRRAVEAELKNAHSAAEDVLA